MNYTILRFLYHRYVQTDYYEALNILMRYQRDIIIFLGQEKVSEIVLALQRSLLHDSISESFDKNPIVLSYLKSEESERVKKLFHGFGEQHLVRMRYPKKKDDHGRQGDLLVLKPFLGPEEKGVLFIQYDEGVKRFSALYDLKELATRYRMVVEPSTSSYQNVMFFLLYGLDTDVVFEAQFEEDFSYIKSIGNNFHSIRLGAGDWADPDLFIDGSSNEKKYDLVMIANWLKWKRHDLFFQTLSRMKIKIKGAAVIGYPIDGRILADIKKECAEHGVCDLVDFFEQISPKHVREILQQSKVGVLLSKEEGANRGIYECFFSNVPVVLTALNRGVNREHLNTSTGMLATDEELVDVFTYMIQNHQSFQTRQWALENTGYRNSTRKLNEYLKNIALASGEKWTRDIYSKHNSPHARYACADEQAGADEEFNQLHQYLRK